MRRSGIHQRTGQKMGINRGAAIKVVEELNRKRREKGRTSMLGFMRYTNRAYDAQWFHKLVCAYLDKLERGEIKKLMIFMPPQHGKSQLSSRGFPAYVLGRNPKTKVAVCSYGKDLPIGFNRDCQNIIDSEAYKELFPATYLNSGQAEGASNEVRNYHMFETVKHRGFLKATAIRAGLTGTSVDLGIIDDPFKDREQANSQLIRDKVWKWYQDVFLTRLDNNGKQLLLFTRWHEDDIAGRILNPKSPYYDAQEAAEWTVIALPALKEETKPMPQAMEVADPRQIDEALWENKHSAAKYKRRRKVNPTGFQSLDQQRPTAEEGNKIRRDWLQVIKRSELPFDPSQISADFFLDGAYTEETKNDETGLLSCYFHKKTGNLYILNASGVRKELYELLKYFRSYARSNSQGTQSSVHIELKASGHSLKSMLSKPEWGGFNTRKINEKTVRAGKFNRVESSEPFLASGKVFLVEGGWNMEFIDQCAAFPNGGHDDMVDCLCYAIHKFFINKGVTVSYEG